MGRMAKEQAAISATRGDNPSSVPSNAPQAQPLAQSPLVVDATTVDEPPNPTKVEEPATPEKSAKKVVDWKSLMAKPVDSLRRHELSAVLALGCGEERLAVLNANSTKAIILAIISHKLREGVFLFLPGIRPQDLVPARVSRITGEGVLLWHLRLARCERPPSSKGNTADGLEGLDAYEV